MMRHSERSLAALAAGAMLAVSMGSVGSLAAQEAELTVTPLFSSYAVLQRGEPIRFWGEASPGADVAATFAGTTREVVADENGRWMAEFAEQEAGGPFDLRVTSGEENVTNKGLLIGDVWVCSGQSNMGFRLEHAIGGVEATAEAGNDRLRLMQMNRRTSNEPVTEADTRGWRPDRPDYAGRFSAVGYLFGRSLQQSAGVPIGMIESTWGGTPLEAWTPEHTLRENTGWSSELLESMAEYDLSKEETEAMVAGFEAAHAAYIAGLLEDEQGMADGWAEAGFDDSSWDELEAPSFWEPVIGNVDGVVWLRRTVSLTASDVGADATLELGMVDEYDDTYVNGVRVGGMNYPSRGAGRKPRAYALPAGVLHAGENTIAIRVVDTRSAGGFGSMADALVLRTGDREVSLAGVWKIRPSHDSRIDGGFPLEGTRMVKAAQRHRRPSALYNGMIHELASVPVRGVIWYQGESNNGRAEQYAKMFPAMIGSWRDAWNSDAFAGREHEALPFLFVQLPNYRTRSEEPEECSWAELREAQTAALALPGVGMAVTMDVGAADDIHPRNKLPVADRLAAVAMADVYEVDDPTAHSPAVVDIETERDGRILIRLSAADGLTTTDGSAPRAFALAGSDGVYRWANAEISGNSIRVWHDEISNPVHVRYAWAWNPDVNTVNGGGRPVAPFQRSLETRR